MIVVPLNEFAPAKITVPSLPVPLLTTSPSVPPLPALAITPLKVKSWPVAASIKAVLKRLDLGEGDTPVAVFVPWRGSATFQRLHGFCQGVTAGLADILARGHPLVLAGVETVVVRSLAVDIQAAQRHSRTVGQVLHPAG